MDVLVSALFPLLIGIYLAGVLVGLLRTDGGLGTRTVLALLWPAGPLAFVLTVMTLLVVAPVALIRFRSNAAAGPAGS